MFASTYFAATFFPSEYFASGASAAPPPGVALKYFTKEYFAPTYFAPTYFPGAAYTVITTTLNGFFDAVSAYCASNSLIQAAGFSGIYADSKPRGLANPALVVLCSSGSLWISDDIHLVYTLRPTFEVMASTKAEAERLAEAVVIPALKNATLAYGTGNAIRTYPFILRDQRKSKDSGETINGERVFRSQVDFEVREIRPRY